MPQVWSNFARAAIATPPTGTSGLSFSVASGKGALFPNPTTGQYFYGVFTNAAKSVYEVVKIEARSSDSFTIEAAGRGLDGTSAQTWNSGDIFFLALTKKSLEEVPYSAASQAIALLTPAADKLAYFTGATTAALTDLTAIARSYLAAATAAAMRVVSLAMGRDVDEYKATLSGTDTYTGNLTPALTSGYPSAIYLLKVPNANTSTTPTINLDGQGAKTVKKGAGSALSPGDISTGWHLYRYDGTDFILLNPSKAVLKGKSTIWIPAVAMQPRLTSGAAGPNVVESSTNKINQPVLDFADGSALYAQAHVSMPKGWDLGTVTVKFHWTKSTGTGDVVWGAQAVAISNDDPMDAAFGTAVTVSDTALTDNDLHVTADSAAITIGGTPVARDHVVFQFYRDGAAGGDTMTATARLLGVEVTFNSSAADDA